MLHSFQDLSNKITFLLQTCSHSFYHGFILYADKFGHGGPLTVSENLPHYGIADRLIKSCNQLGIDENEMYNLGDIQGRV